MKASASIELVWQFAAREAIASEFKEIEPDHFLEAVVTFADIPVSELEKIGNGSDVVKALIAEVTAVQAELECLSIDGTGLRRQLIEELGKGGSPHTGGVIHRSQATRELFDRAVRIAADAGSEALQAEHLLDALLMEPTPRIKKLLQQPAEKATCRKGARPAPTPLLDAAGQDLTRLALENKLPPVTDRQGECKALLNALGHKSRKSILFVADSGETARQVVVSAAQVIASGSPPRDVKGRRLIDLTRYAIPPHESPDSLTRFEALMAEAANAKEVVLFIPLPLVDRDQATATWVAALQARMRDRTVQCACCCAAMVYERFIQNDPAWRELADVMWVHQKHTTGIPHEL